jgi:hypothetical protein
MAGYQRKTALTPSEILSRAEEIIPERIGLSKTNSSGHGATYSGDEGTVTLAAHPHGYYTEVVASTDRLRTSKLDYEIQIFLNHLPYEPGDESKASSDGEG